MTQKTKVIIGSIAFVIVIAGATIAYNVLSKNIKPSNDFTVVADDTEEKVEEEKSDVELTQEQAVSEEKPDVELAKEEGTVEANNQDLRQAIDFTMVDKDGNTILLSEMIANNKPIILNFWASWCPPCKSEMPDFDTVYKELGSEVQFMMINMTDGQRETVEIGAQYIEEQGFSFPVYFDVNQEGATNYQIYSIPTTVFINANGYMVTGAQGAIDEETLRKGIGMIMGK